MLEKMKEIIAEQLGVEEDEITRYRDSCRRT